MEPIHSGPMASRTVLVTGGTGGIGRRPPWPSLPFVWVRLL
jgi:hypothetical protein